MWTQKEKSTLYIVIDNKQTRNHVLPCSSFPNIKRADKFFYWVRTCSSWPNLQL